MRFVTLDTNIYISALEFGGKPMRLLEAGLEGEVHISISQPIIDETMRVLRDKFGWTETDLRGGEATMLAATHLVTPTITLAVVKDDPDDDRIVECAVEAASEAIITHDKDLLRMSSYQGIKMMKAVEFLQLMDGALAAQSRTLRL